MAYLERSYYLIPSCNAVNVSDVEYSANQSFKYSFALL